MRLGGLERQSPARFDSQIAGNLQRIVTLHVDDHVAAVLAFLIASRFNVPLALYREAVVAILELDSAPAFFQYQQIIALFERHGPIAFLKAQRVVTFL